MADAHDLAVMLNENARRVSRRVQRTFAQYVPQARLYSAHTLDEARQQVREALDQGYQRIVCGGGDGTIVHILNAIREHVDEQNDRLRELGAGVRDQIDQLQWPTIGILKLGTGNGWAFDVRSRRPLDALRRLAAPEPLGTRQFHLVESERTLFHFAGLGYDAAVLNDYTLFKQRFARGPLKAWFKGLGGYLTALALKSVPEQLLRSTPAVRVSSNDGEVYRAVHGRPPERLPVGRGETIYEGPVTVTGAGTTHSYGYGLQAFPFASAMPGFFNLRVIRAGVLECLRHAVPIVRGTYGPPSFLDFLAREVTFEFDRPMPYQIGGDSQGYRERLHYRVADIAVDVFDFATP